MAPSLRNCSTASMPAAHHILTYAETLYGGGVERAQLRLAGGWLAAGRRVTLVVEDPGGPLADELPEGLHVVRGALRMLPRIVAGLGPDIVFCPGNHYTATAAMLRLRLGRRCPPIVAKMSNAAVRGDHGAVMRRLHALWLGTHGGFLDHLVAMTPATAAEAARATRMTRRTTVIANPPATVTGAPLPPLPPRFILGVGRLEPQKRWDRLIAALPRLAEPRIALVILGEGRLRASLEAQASGLNVQFPGHIADPIAAMARAQVVALTSDYEGVPGVLREALSVGTPVVATNSSRSVAEIVTHDALGTIVPPDDPHALVAALDRWLEPGAPRPPCVPPPGADAAERYLALFDRIVSARRSRPRVPTGARARS